MAELSGIPALLAKLDRADVGALDEEQPSRRCDPRCSTRCSHASSARRRRSRWVTTAALAAAAAVLAVGLVIAIRPESLGLQTGTDQAAGSAMEMTKVSPTPINATISMTGYGWGTRIDMACTYGDWGRRDAPPQNLGHGRRRPRRQSEPGRDMARVVRCDGVAQREHTPPVEEIAAVQLVSSDSGRYCSKNSCDSSHWVNRIR